MNRKFLLLCAFIIFFSSCSDHDDVSPLTDYDRSVIQYFTEIALGFEFGGATEITRKWSSGMKLFVGGNKSSDLMDELQDITKEINELATDGFSISIVTDTLQSNFYLFIGSGQMYASIFPSQSSLINSNWGLFSVYWNGADQLYKGNMYVDNTRANTAEQKHLLREELTQSLGLAKDSFRYPESMFQQNWTTTTEYAEIDKDLIRLLYHPDMQISLNKAQVEELLEEIILSEK
jgi:hypothetical protein